MNRHHRRKIAALGRAELRRRAEDPVLYEPGSEFFTCTVCRERFRKGRPDAQAIAEMRAREGNLPPEEQCAVCDDCHKLLMEVAPA